MTKPIAIPELEDTLSEHRAKLLTLQPRCHGDAGMDVFYVAGSGVLNICCRQCQKVVAEICVALISGLKDEDEKQD